MVHFKHDEAHRKGESNDRKRRLCFSLLWKNSQWKIISITNEIPRGDISELGLYYYDGVRWRTACDADGNLLPGGFGWMVPGSRVDHYESNTAFIEFQAYHFSGTQGFVVVSSGTEDRETNQGNSAHVFISCFIDTAAANWEPAWHWILGLMGCVPVVLIILVRRGKHM